MTVKWGWCATRGVPYVNEPGDTLLRLPGSIQDALQFIENTVTKFDARGKSEAWFHPPHIPRFDIDVDELRPVLESMGFKIRTARLLTCTFISVSWLNSQPVIRLQQNPQATPDRAVSS